MVKTFEFAFAEFLEETGRINDGPMDLLRLRCAFLGGWILMHHNWQQTSLMTSLESAAQSAREINADALAAADKLNFMLLEVQAGRLPPP